MDAEATQAADTGTTLRAALVQFYSDLTPGGTLTNLVRMSHLVARAAEQGAGLIVFPELSTCGYGCSDEALLAALTDERLVLETFTRLATQHAIRIVASYPTRDPSDGRLYIAASVFAPRTGEIELTYHKTHPWAASMFERKHFALGKAFAPSIPLHLPAPAASAADEDSSASLEDVWLNVLICWDIEFPEPARTVRLSTPGTHHASPLVLCIPTANADGAVAAYTVRARAAENHTFVLYANCAGAQFCGGSIAVAPDGIVLGEIPGTGEGMILVDLDVGSERYADKRKVNPMLEWRRPELYTPIADVEVWPKPSDPPPPVV